MLQNNSYKYQLKLLLYVAFIYFCLIMIFSSVFQTFGWSRDYIGYKKIFTFEYGLALLSKSLFGSNVRDFIYAAQAMIGLNKSGNVSDFMSPLNAKYLILLISFVINAFVTPKTDSVNTVLMKVMAFGLCFYYWLLPINLPVISVRLAEFYTSVFVLYFFLNVRNFKFKEKKIIQLYDMVVVLLYSIASIRTSIL